MSCPHPTYKNEPDGLTCLFCGHRILKAEARGLTTVPAPSDRAEPLAAACVREEPAGKEYVGYANLPNWPHPTFGERLCLVHALATCPHGLAIEEGDVRCRYCGAWRTVNFHDEEQTYSDWTPTHVGLVAIELDADRQKAGASWGRPAYDSDVENVIPIKPRT